MSRSAVLQATAVIITSFFCLFRLCLVLSEDLVQKKHSLPLKFSSHIVLWTVPNLNFQLVAN
jgi:hypothetical protein